MDAAAALASCTRTAPKRAPTRLGSGRKKRLPGRAGQAFSTKSSSARSSRSRPVSEIKIDLKPDFLAIMRMQIVSENQQVSVRILTELPAVRDMIETGLQQLRSSSRTRASRGSAGGGGIRRPPPVAPAPGAPDELPKPGASAPSPAQKGRLQRRGGGRLLPSARAGSTATIDMFV
jgi:hypothetical protein